jgi:MFS family permease
MNRIRNEVAYLRENEIESYRQLFRSPLRRPFLLGIGIQILQQLTGINATMYYAPDIFEKLFPNNTNASHDIIQASPLFATGINGCVNVIATIPTLIFIDRLGRRILLMTGAIIMSISMAIVAVLEANYRDDDRTLFISWIIIVFIYIFVGGFAFSWGPIAWIYCAEIFPLTMRAKATSLTTAANWVTNCAISLLVPIVFGRIYYRTFIIFAILCGIMIGIVYFFYPETKNRHLEENNSNRIFVSQRKNYNTFAQQPVVGQTHIPFTTIQPNDYLPLKNLDSSS